MVDLTFEVLYCIALGSLGAVLFSVVIAHLYWLYAYFNKEFKN